MAGLPPNLQLREPQSLLENPNNATKERILDCFFGKPNGIGSRCSEEYFEYYNRELRLFRTGVSSLISTLAIKTHDDLLHICQLLKNGRLRPREDVRKDILHHFKTEDHLAVDRSVDLTVRLWLMVNARDTALPLWMPEQSSLHWDDSCSLQTFIDAQFRPSTMVLGYRESRLDPTFTVASMVRMGSIDVRWTESIDDHLRLDSRRMVLSVFPYKSVLVGQLNTTVEDGGSK